MTGFLTRPLAGFAGDLTRVLDTNVETASFAKDAAAVDVPTAYGVPVTFNANGYIEAFVTGDVAADIVGILGRTSPTINGTIDQTFTSAVPNVATNQNLVVQGYVNVVCADAAPVRGQPVYVRTVENLPALVGDLESVSVPGENVIIPNYVWAIGGRDANNIAELRLNV